MAQGMVLNKTASKIAMLILGELGQRKSETALGIAKLKRPDGKPFRVLYIDPEMGSVVDRAERWERDFNIDMKNVYLLYTQSMAEVAEYIDKAKNNDTFYVLDENGEETDEVLLDADGKPFVFDAIVVDGLQLLKDSVNMALLEVAKDRVDVRIEEKQNNKKGNPVEISDKKKKVLRGNISLEPKDYGLINNEGTKLILKLLSSNKHFICTSFAKDATVDDEAGRKDGFGNILKHKTGKLLADSFKGCEKYVKTILCLSVDDFNNLSVYVQDKDRTETFMANTFVENFDMTMLQPIVLKSANAVPIKNSYEQSFHDNAKTCFGEEENKKNVISKTSTETTVNDVTTLRAKIVNILNNSDSVKSKRIKSELKQNGFGNPTKMESLEELEKCWQFFVDNEMFNK